MPNVFRVGNFRLVIFPNDHEPPHAHAIGPDWDIKIALGNGEEIKPRNSGRLGENYMAEWIDKEIAANKKKAMARGRADRKDFPHATAAAYSPEHDLIVIDLENGSKFAFPPRIAQGLEHATPEQLGEIEVTPGGYGLLWPKIDAALSVRGLLLGTMGSMLWAREMARKGGQVSSPAKAAAARANGAKGGRPPKMVPSRQQP